MELMVQVEKKKIFRHQLLATGTYFENKRNFKIQGSDK